MSSGLLKTNSNELTQNVVFSQFIDSVQKPSSFNTEICNCSEIEHYFECSAICDNTSSYISKFLNYFKIPQKRVTNTNDDVFLFILNKVRRAFDQCKSNLSHEKKFQICALERYLMKLYLVTYMKQYNLD